MLNIVVKICLISIITIVPFQSFAKDKPVVLDGTKWNLDSSNVINLDTDWELYWNKLLEPKDFKRRVKPKKTGNIHYPKLWNGHVVNGVKLLRDGYATYRLTIMLPKEKKIISIKVPELATAYKMFINGVTSLAQGDVGTSYETSSAKVGSREIHFSHRGGKLEIVMQISSFHHKDGGTRFPIQIASSEAMSAEGNLLSIVDSFLIGTMFIMAFYHFVLFFQRRRAYSSLFFAAFCSLVGLHTLTGGDGGILTAIFPDINFELHKKIKYISFYLAVPVIASFFKVLFPEEQPKLFSKIIWGITCVFLLTVLFTSVSTYAWTLPAFQIIAAVVAVALVMQCIVAAIRQKEAALLLLAGMFIVAVSLLADILSANGIISKSIHTTAIGLYIFIYIKSVLLSTKFSNLSTKVDEYKSENITLMDLDKQKDSFFQNLSHEIRTPLTLIMGPLEIANEKYTEDKTIKMALRNAKRLIKLVNQFLNFQEILSGKHQIQTTLIDLVPFLRTCSEHFESACKSKNIVFELNLSSSGWVFISAKIDYLEKIVYNLLTNALKFTPEGGRIELKLEDLGEVSRISVKDSGIGIDEKDKETLFEMFGKIKGKVVHSSEGSGLGLPFVKKLVTEMNGKVGVESQPGLGSIFWVEFNVSETKMPVLDLLFVDDDYEIRDFFDQNMIEFSGTSNYQIAESAAEAKRIIDSHRVKCLVTDMVMANEDGVELVEYVNQVQPNCENLLVTGSANAELLHKAINTSNISKIIEKPWSPEKFIEIIKIHIAKSRVEDDVISDVTEYKPKDWQLADYVMSEDVIELVDNNLKPITKRDEKIIILDEVAEIRTIVERVLKYHGFTVRKAKNIQQAKEIMKKEVIDLLVLDWRIEGESGIEFIKTISTRKEFSGIPTLMLSARSDIDSKLEFIESGATSFMSKPFDTRELVGVINNLLALKKSEGELREVNRFLLEDVLKKYLPAHLVENIVSSGQTKDSESHVLPVTLLVVDLCSLRTKSSLVGPSRMSKILNPYFDRMNKIIYANNGVVDKYISDTIVVLFGSTTAEDAPSQMKHAVKCADEMFYINSELSEELSRVCDKIEYSIRIGIHHGPAVVGSFGNDNRSEFMAVGQTVQHAIDIKNAASAGQILTSEIVRDLLSKDSWQRAGTFNMESTSGNIPLYELKVGESDKKAA